MTNHTSSTNQQAFIWVLFGLLFGLLAAAANFATGAVSEVQSHPTKWVCIQADGTTSGGDNSKTAARENCEAVAEDNPGTPVLLSSSWTLTATPDPTPIWVVKPYWLSDDRAIYACDEACLAAQDRGDQLGRSDPELVGRCDGPLAPVWGTATNQWQFHTNQDGISGLVYCTLTIDYLPPLSPPVEPPEAEPAYFLASAPDTPQIVASGEAMKAPTALWRLRYSTGIVGRDTGLVSRDQTGQNQPGHFDVRLDSSNRVVVRMQGHPTGLVELRSTSTATSGPQVLDILRTPDLVTLTLNGVLEASTDEIYPTAGNDLPLVLGASCQSCTGSDGTGVKWVAPFAVELEIFVDSMPPEIVVEPPEEPVDPVEPPEEPYLATASWERPVAYTNGTPIDPALPVRYTIYYGTQSGVYTETVDAGTNTLQHQFELERGSIYYLVITATVNNVESSYAPEFQFDKLAP